MAHAAGAPATPFPPTLLRVTLWLAPARKDSGPPAKGEPRFAGLLKHAACQWDGASPAASASADGTARSHGTESHRTAVLHEGGAGAAAMMRGAARRGAQSDDDDDDFVPGKATRDKHPHQQQRTLQWRPHVSPPPLVSNTTYHWVSGSDFELSGADDNDDSFASWLVRRFAIPAHLIPCTTFYLQESSRAMLDGAATAVCHKQSHTGEASLATVLRAFRDAVEANDNSGDGLVLKLGVCVRVPIEMLCEGGSAAFLVGAPPAGAAIATTEPVAKTKGAATASGKVTKKKKAATTTTSGKGPAGRKRPETARKEPVATSGAGVVSACAMPPPGTVLLRPAAVPVVPAPVLTSPAASAVPSPPARPQPLPAAAPRADSPRPKWREELCAAPAPE